MKLTKDELDNLAANIVEILDKSYLTTGQKLYVLAYTQWLLADKQTPTYVKDE